MAGASYNLAMETSTRCGSVAVGRGDELLAHESLPPQQRHTVELLPRIDALARRFGFTPHDLAEVYVSIGPGSFTGLRIAVTMAKMFARVTGCKLVAVPTLDVVVRNAPDDATNIAVMLNAKRGQCFTGLYERSVPLPQVGERLGEGDGRRVTSDAKQTISRDSTSHPHPNPLPEREREQEWRTVLEPSLLTPAQVCERAERPLTVIGDHLPDYHWPADVTIITDDRAVPRAEVLWQLARAAAKTGQYVDPYALTPLYVRLPEAEELWQQRNRVSEDAADK
ncbi:MAG: tRNA (adenosine(37)-N6)-threonylcarbamoyltransferase complex dimerization subunit type 1 TsaB [Phycisphaerales bacterium]